MHFPLFLFNRKTINEDIAYKDRTRMGEEYMSGGISLSFMKEHDNIKDETNLLKAIRATEQAAIYDSNVK